MHLKTFLEEIFRGYQQLVVYYVFLQLTPSHFVEERQLNFYKMEVIHC